MKKLFKTGEIFIWFTGFGLAVTLLMISGLLVLVLLKGSDYYYPSKLASVSTVDGKNYLGQMVREEPDLSAAALVQDLLQPDFSPTWTDLTASCVQLQTEIFMVWISNG
ncbi:MAG: hypothetical protein P8Y79_13750 [Ignavibacteriaceae bacterium]